MNTSFINGKRAIVVGFGSIGQRHASLLEVLGVDVHVVSRRQGVHRQAHRSIREAVSNVSFDYAVIADETSRHYETVKDLENSGFRGRGLIEKPVWHIPQKSNPEWHRRYRVGYVLRHDPLIQKLKTVCENEEILSVQAQCGSYLPDWRPGRDYRDTESSADILGGGVLRDLSHELDYVQHLCGDWRRVAANGGHHSQLELQTSDVFQLIMETARCPCVTVHLDYFAREESRICIVNTTKHSFRADMIAGKLFVDGKPAFSREENANEWYTSQLVDAFCPSPQTSTTLKSAETTVKLIEAAESSAVNLNWVRNT